MKCLSVRQPWLWAMFNLGKDVENRSWPTKYRGPVAIHASRFFTLDAIVEDLRYCKWLALKTGVTLPPSPSLRALKAVTGGIVGVATLVDCVRGHSSSWAEPGAWHWVFADHRGIKFQPLKGRLGLFDAEVGL